MPKPNEAENGKPEDLDDPTASTNSTEDGDAGNEGPPDEGGDDFDEDLEALFADQDEGPPSEGEDDDQEIEVDGEKVKLSELLNAHKGKKEWQKNNTEKSMKLSEQERQLRQQAEELRARETQLKTLEQNIWNMQGQQQQQPGTPGGQQQDDVLGIELDEFSDPATVQLAKTVQNLQNQLKQNQQTFEQQQFIQQTRALHGELGSKYQDYDPVAVETRILEGRSNRFEDVHKAMKYEQIEKAEPEVLKKLIPESMVKEIRAEERKKIIADAQKRLKMRKKGAAPKPKPGLSKQPEEAPKTYYDIKKGALEMIDQMEASGKSLFK